MEESNSENKYTMIPLIIYPEDSSDNEEDPPPGILWGTREAPSDPSSGDNNF